MASYMVWKVENKYDLDLGNWVGPLGNKLSTYISARTMRVLTIFQVSRA